MRMYYVSDEMYVDSFYNMVNAEYTQDIPFYLDCCRQYGTKVLEACCGNGRVTIALKQAGINVSGFDRSAQMLSGAKKRAFELGLSIPFYEMDILNFRLPEQYDLIVLPFNSLQYLYTLLDQKTALRNIRNHLTPGGHFIFDVFHPKINRIVQGEKHKRLLKRILMPDGCKVNIYETLHYISDQQVLCSKWHICQNDQDQEKLIELDSHCYFPFELRQLIEGMGFHIETVFGSFNKQPFSASSSKQIYICSI